jgi:hypothetical protein
VDPGERGVSRGTVRGGGQTDEYASWDGGGSDSSVGSATGCNVSVSMRCGVLGRAGRGDGRRMTSKVAALPPPDTMFTSKRLFASVALSSVILSSSAAVFDCKLSLKSEQFDLSPVSLIPSSSRRTSL